MLSVIGKYNTYWFSEKVSTAHAFGLNNYRQCVETKNRLGFIKKISYTKIINLKEIKNSSLEILSKNTRYEIRQAIKKGVEFRIDSDVKFFIEFYNQSTNQKKLHYQSLAASSQHLLISKALINNDHLVSHMYICDKNTKRARLLYSISRKTDDHETKKIIGFANRFLHSSDIDYFMEHDYIIYDLGGYAYNTQDPKLQNINKLKDEFGKILICEGNYKSYVFFLAQKIKEIFNK